MESSFVETLPVPVRGVIPMTDDFISSLLGEKPKKKEVKSSILFEHAPDVYKWAWGGTYSGTSTRSMVEGGGEEGKEPSQEIGGTIQYIPWNSAENSVKVSTYTEDIAIPEKFLTDGTVKPMNVDSEGTGAEREGPAVLSDDRKQLSDIEKAIDAAGLPDEVKRQLEYVVRKYCPDESYLSRFMKYEEGREQILDALRTSRIADEGMQTRKHIEEISKVRWEQQQKIHWEKSFSSGAASEAFLEEFMKGRKIHPGPPPVSRSPKSAFFICCDVSGSAHDDNVYDTETAVVYSLIREAEEMQKRGRSHFMAIYAFDNILQYPKPWSAYPPRGRFNPLPTDNMRLLLEDFGRFWPGPHGGTSWRYLTGVMVDDYMKFGVGDIFFFADGDIGDEMSGMDMGVKAATDHYFAPTFSKYCTHDNPTPLTVIQAQKRDALEQGEPVGMGTFFYLPHGRYVDSSDIIAARYDEGAELEEEEEEEIPVRGPINDFVQRGFPCSRCGSSPLVYRGRTPDKKVIAVCPRGHENILTFGECPLDSCPHNRSMSCRMCMYVILVLRELFGNRIFVGNDPKTIYAQVADLIGKIQDRNDMIEIEEER